MMFQIFFRCSQDNGGFYFDETLYSCYIEIIVKIEIKTTFDINAQILVLEYIIIKTMLNERD